MIRTESTAQCIAKRVTNFKRGFPALGNIRNRSGEGEAERCDGGNSAPKFGHLQKSWPQIPRMQGRTCAIQVHRIHHRLLIVRVEEGKPHTTARQA